jgi:hypothetical protein
MDRPKRNKVYYVPGIISLTILPVAFTMFANKEIKQRTVSVLPIVFANTNLPKKFPEFFKDFNYSLPPKRNYLNINLTGNQQHDNIKLDFAQIRIREILSQNDSVNGVHFKFGDSSQYWSFVRTVDILRFEKAKTYLPLDNDLWFYHFPPDTTLVNWICGTMDCYTVYIDPKVSFWTKATKRTREIWKSSWQIISAFIAFLLLSLMFKIQKNRT